MDANNGAGRALIVAYVKSCGPGIPVLMPSATRAARCRDTGANEPVPEESAYKR